VDATFNVLNDFGLNVQQKESVRPKKDRQAKTNYFSGEIEGLTNYSGFGFGVR